MKDRDTVQVWKGQGKAGDALKQISHCVVQDRAANGMVCFCIPEAPQYLSSSPQAMG